MKKNWCATYVWKIMNNLSSNFLAPVKIFLYTLCLKEWLKVSYDILTCGVCKKNISPNFIQKYVSLDDLLAYPYKSNMYVNNERHMMFTYRTYIGGSGIPYAELVNGKLIFETDNERSIFLEARKRNYLSERHKNKRYMK